MKFSQLLVLIWSISTPLVVETSVNLALGKPTSQSSDFNAKWDSSKAVDGCFTQTITSDCCTHTEGGRTEVWWKVDLQQQSVIESVYITYRNEGTLYRLAGFEIYLSYTSDWRKGVRCYKDYTDNVQFISAIQHVPCSGVARYVTIYNDRRMKSKWWYSDDAVLELCEVNVYGCPVGKYGAGHCDSDCTTCANNGYTCKPASNMCDICAPGYYSQSCSPCPVNCKDNFCARDSGACIECSPGFSGTYCRCPLNCKDATCPPATGYCTECVDSYYGYRCNLTCPRNCISNVCVRSNGQCTECFDSFYGDRCNLTCPSNCLTNVCARSNGQCTACKPGFFGTHCRCPANCRDQSCPGDYCNECDIGYYGIRCDLVCPNNCDNMGCNRTSGECIACTPGFSGTYCRCPANCRDETCPADTGYCNDCNDGYYGQFCTPCPDSCRNNACNKTSGYCLECNDGYFNIHCNQSCPVNCKGRICNIDSAECTECDNGYYTIHCNQSCPVNCKGRICNIDSGECTECEPGFHGSLCNQTCPTNCKNNICIMQDGRCLEIEALTSDPDSQIGTHAGVGVGTAVLIIVVIVLVVVVLRRRKSQSKESTTSQFDDDSDIRTLSQPPKQQRLDSHAVSQRQTPPANDDRIAYMNVGDVGNMEQVAYSNVKAMNGDSIEDIRAMISKKMKNGQEVFKNEFKVLPWGAVHPHLEGAKPANKTKNRFKTTFPYDHSRVILNKIGNDPDSTYINANFIDSVDADNVYVACQGPKEKTVNDFWRMIWQLNTGKIVMVTNLVEGGHVKCYQYWPNEGSPLDTRHFNITLDRERTYAFYVIREISLSKKTTKEERQVHQFHFTAWPDHGTPNNIELVLFHRRVTSCVTHLTGQMVVHCSAGLGRTGTFIGLDALSKAERESGRVDILEYIRTMRKDRMNMIQTHEQYIALHELLVEAADLSNTLISRMKFPDALQNILPAGRPTNQTKLRIEFGKLQTLIPIYDSDSYTAGMMAKNKDKNRTMSNIAVDMFRAFLRSQGRGRTDYINAVLLQSHRSKTGYLITQFPLKDTIDDFWTLVVDYNCENIVVLGTPSEHWLREESETDNAHEVYVKKDNSLEVITDVDIVDYVITSKMSHSDTLIRVFTMKQWSSDSLLPPSDSSLLLLLEQLDSRRRSDNTKPVIVMCRDGCKQSGLFCCISNARDQMKMDDEVDIFQNCRQLQIRRPQALGNIEQYQYCYSFIGQYLDSTNVYIN